MEIKSGGNVITNPIDIASKFNDYFVNVGPDRAKKISPGAPSASIKDTMPAPNPISFFAIPCTAKKIQTDC